MVKKESLDEIAIVNASIGDKIRFIIRDATLYGLSSAAGRLVSFVSFPVLTRIFSPDEYGSMDAILVFSSIAVLLVILGQDSAVARFYYEVQGEDERRQVVSQAFLIQLLVGIAVLGTLLLTGTMLAEKNVFLYSHRTSFCLALMNLPFLMVANFTRNLLKWTFARKEFMVLSLGSTVAIATTSILGAVVLNRSLWGFFAGILVANVMFAGVGLWYCRRFFTWPLTTFYSLPLIKYGWPCMATGLVAAALPAVDRTVILGALGADSLGLYAAGFRLASLMALPIGAFQIAWNPISLAIYKAADAEQTYNQVLLYATAAFSLFGILISHLAAPLLLLLASNKYAGGSAVVLPLIFGQIVQACAWIGGLGIDLSKRTYYGTLSYLIGLAIAITAMSVFVPLGILGVSLGVMGGQIATGGAYILFGHWVYPLRFSFRKPLAITVTAALFSSMSFFLPGSLSMGEIVISGLIVCASAIVICWILWGNCAWARIRQLTSGLGQLGPKCDFKRYVLGYGKRRG